jgi:hypothetical protein
MTPDEYKAKREARIARYLQRAEAADAEADAHWNSPANQTLSSMGGEPIKIGHHSEKRHRALIARAHRDCDKACEAMAKARHYRAKAEAAKGNRAVYTDDPEALVKLRGQLASLEANQRQMKAINAAWRKAGRPAPDDLEGWKRVADDAAVMMNVNDLAGVRRDMAQRIGWHLDGAPFPGYALRNLNANIRRIKERIAELEKRTEEPEAEAVEGEGFRISEDREWGRILIEFDGKPPEAVRTYLKQHGWRWAPSRLAWVRHLNGNGQAYANLAAERLPDLLK